MAGDKFIPEMHLKQPGFTCSASGPLNKNKERIKKYMQKGNTDYFYKNGLNKARFHIIWPMINIKILLKEQNQINC